MPSQQTELLTKQNQKKSNENKEYLQGDGTGHADARHDADHRLQQRGRRPQQHRETTAMVLGRLPSALATSCL